MQVKKKKKNALAHFKCFMCVLTTQILDIDKKAIQGRSPGRSGWLAAAFPALPLRLNTLEDQVS